MSIFKEFQKIKGISAVPVTAERDAQIGALTIDVAERDIGDGLSKLNIIIFKAKGIGRDDVEPAILKACKEVFGKNRKHIDLIYRDEREIMRREGLSRPANAFDSWIIEILPPRSSRFRVESLQPAFLYALNRHL